MTYLCMTCLCMTYMYMTYLWRKEEGDEGEAANLEEMPSFPPVVNIGVSNSMYMMNTTCIKIRWYD